MTSSRLRLFAFASVSSLLVLGMIASGCGASANGTSFSDEDDASGGGEGDSGKKGDATTSDGGFGTDSGGTKDGGEASDAAEEEDATVTLDAGKDASSVVDAGIDSGTVVDAGTDAGTTTDAGSVDAGPVDAGPTATTIVISEIKSRGTGGGNDEFIELYNPTASAVVLDNTWTLNSRSTTTSSCASTGTVVWTGTGKTIPAHGHFLVVGADYVGATAKDEALTTGVTDASSVTLRHATTLLDAVCYAFDATGLARLTTGCSSNPYICEGTPLASPHDNDSDTNVNASLERKPGGALGNGADSNDNSADFVTSTPSNPQNTSSAATP